VLPTCHARTHICSVQQALLAVIAEGKYRTRDLGGTSTTSDFTKAVIDKLE
jgi:isocitrate dehydrogenase (NAD+)